MSTATILIGPEHDGQPMSLHDFDQCEVREGYLYELAQGVVAVIDVPKPRHGQVVRACRKQFEEYETKHSGRIHASFGGSECKVVVPSTESERHPDLAVYLSPCPDLDADVWSNWIPDLVVEVVSDSSRVRDYDEKPRDYLEAGIQEYWIIDLDENRVTRLMRDGDSWKETAHPATGRIESPLFPGLTFELDRIGGVASD